LHFIRGDLQCYCNFAVCFSTHLFIKQLPFSVLQKRNVGENYYYLPAKFGYQILNFDEKLQKK